MCKAESMEDDSKLELEANWLHEFFFRAEPSAELVRQYVRAERHYSRLGRTSAIHCDMAELARAGVDLEALEFFLRLTRRSNDLTRKFATYCMLAEVKSAHLQSFVLLSDKGFFRASVDVLAAASRAVFKLVKGSLAARRLRLV